MQIVSLGIYGRNGARRDVRFKLGALNILTGKSKTGKSAILDIAEFCLGRNTVTIPTGVISENAAWYYVLLQIRDERVLICRPNPETASTGRAMVRTGGVDLLPPDIDALEINADTDVIRDTLSERLGIERFAVEAEPGSLRQPFNVSVRQALFFNFQAQNEIANRDILFHRQAEDDIRATIKDSLPYFLGAATPEQATLRRQLVAARRSLQRTENQLRAAEADADQQDVRVTQLLEHAFELGILGRPQDTADVLGALGRIASFEYVAPPGDSETHDRWTALAEQAQRLRSDIREVDGQIELLESLQREFAEATRESDFQHQRLSALEVLLPKAPSTAHSDGSVCPLCDQELSHPDESVAELRALLQDLTERLTSSRGVSARRGQAIERLKASREPLLQALGETVAAQEAAAREEAAIASGREHRERVAFLQGRVSQELERGVAASGGLAELRSTVRRLRGQVARLEETYERNDPASAVREAADSISDLLTDYARTLELEGAEGYVRFDPGTLAVVVQRPGLRIPLARMGSAENWVGYHLAGILAIHTFFSINARPVPRFVILDQPTQAFFPEEVVDAAEDQNADWEAVRRQFMLIRDVVATRQGDLQVIVCDHANLADQWFQDRLVDNWRNGVALIPESWIAQPAND